MEKEKTIKNAAYAGVVGVLILTLMIIFEIFTHDTIFTQDSLLFNVYVFLNIFMNIAWIYFLWGYKILGDDVRNQLLVIVTYLGITFFVVQIFGLILVLFIPTLASFLYLLLIVSAFIFVGIVNIFFGLSLLGFNKRDRKRFGSALTATAILSIVVGALFVSIIFFLPGLLLTVVLIISGTILLFKSSEIIGIRERARAKRAAIL